MSGRNVLVTSINPHRLTSAMRLNFSNGSHSTGAITVIPALFTSPQSPENGGKQFFSTIEVKSILLILDGFSMFLSKKPADLCGKQVFLVLVRKPCLLINHFLAVFPRINNEATFENILLSCRILSEWRGVGIFVTFRYSVIFHKAWFPYGCICRICRVCRTKKIHRTDRIHSIS